MVQKIIGWMRHRTLEEIEAEPEVQKLFDVLYQRHLALGGPDSRAARVRTTALCTST